MYVFSRIEQASTNIKCHYPDCQNHAIWFEKMPLYDILLCEQHKAAQEYIHVANNLPYSVAPDLLLIAETFELPPKVSE